MNPIAVFGSAVWFCIWCATVLCQLLVPTFMVWVLTSSPTGEGAFGALMAFVMLLTVTGLLTAAAGGLNSIPSIFWRFGKVVDARIIEVRVSEGGCKFAVKMRLFGAWIWVSAPERGGLVRIAWCDAICPGVYLVDHQYQAERHLENLGCFLSEGFTDSTYTESVERATFDRGVRRPQ